MLLLLLLLLLLLCLCSGWHARNRAHRVAVAAGLSRRVSALRIFLCCDAHQH
jgi:hypothetical protein